MEKQWKTECLTISLSHAPSCFFLSHGWFFAIQQKHIFGSAAIFHKEADHEETG
jgi:hypothetical protein